MNTASHSSRHAQGAQVWRAWGVVGVWAVLLAGGLAVLADYSSRPGVGGGAPHSWPESSGIPREPGAPVLVLFVHPKCACTSATLSELERALVWNKRATRLVVSVVCPNDAPAGWGDSALTRRAGALPGATGFADTGGAEARRFGAATSGHAVLYGADGALLFQGGLTGSRGHEGENAGRRAIEVFLAGSTTACREHPTFGCPLANDCADACADGVCQEPTP